MSFSYATFKQDIAQSFIVLQVPKKDMLAKTDGPPMRVATLRLSANMSTLDDSVLQSIPMVSG
jgi:hypothetical protein